MSTAGFYFLLIIGVIIAAAALTGDWDSDGVAGDDGYYEETVVEYEYEIIEDSEEEGPAQFDEGGMPLPDGPQEYDENGMLVPQ